MTAHSDTPSPIRPTSDAVRNELQLACFRIGAEFYALDIMRIKEIIRPLKVTPVPKAPPFVEVVINLRGAVIPVVDLRKRFDQTPDLTRKTRVIICAVEKKILGVVVDEVMEVRRYSRQEVLPNPRFLKGRGADFFSGVCRRGEDLVLLLNLKMILSTEERIDIETIQLSEESIAVV